MIKELDVTESHLHIPCASQLHLPLIKALCLTELRWYVLNVFVIISSCNFTSENESVVS